MGRKRKKYDPYAEFRAMSKHDKLQNILDIAAFCIDGAPVSLARKIEIYFDVAEDEQKQRHIDIRERNNMGP